MPAPMLSADNRRATDRGPLIELRNVHAGYDGINVLHGVELSVAAGQVLAVLGPNGAGKSTMLRLIAGLHPILSGDLTVAGRRVNGASPEDLARAGLCLIPEGRGIFPNLTVHENLWMMTYGARGARLRQIESSAFDHFPKLADRRSQIAGTLSGGEQQMLALARGLVTNPAVLLLDELSMGLAPLVVEQLYAMVAQVASDGITIVIVEQFASIVLGIASRAAVMSGGRIVAEGDPAAIEATLSKTYLGN
ncbi:MAG: ABC transporter ATP-binding protein [Actinomycetes bacterium]